MKTIKKLFVATLCIATTLLSVSCGRDDDDISATGSNRNEPTITSDGLFSVGPNKKVRFSKGNLQYQPSTNTWRFAEHQYDVICEQNYYSLEDMFYEGIPVTYDGWIDIFKWGSSGWDCGNTYYHPCDKVYGGYMMYGPYHDLTGEYANSDWGVYNPIANGGNRPGLWRTISYYEAHYLTRERKVVIPCWYYDDFKIDTIKSGGATIRCKINNVIGDIILPDVFNVPQGMRLEYRYGGFIYFKLYGLEGYGEDGVCIFDTHNGIIEISLSDWQKFESVGCVFLPMSYTMCDYWTCTKDAIIDGESLNYYPISAWTWTSDGCYQRCRNESFPVRLIQDVQ